MDAFLQSDIEGAKTHLKSQEHARKFVDVRGLRAGYFERERGKNSWSFVVQNYCS